MQLICDWQRYGRLAELEKYAIGIQLAKLWAFGKDIEVYN